MLFATRTVTSTPCEVDEFYARAKSAGAIGGKLTGAGGGGFLMLFVPPEDQRSVREALSELVHVPFRFETSGSQIIFFDPEEDFAAAEEERATRPIREFRELDPAPIPYPEHAEKAKTR